MSAKIKKVFIIGNGFDLNLGYPTRFKDFIAFCTNWKSFYDRDSNEKYVKGLNESNINDMKLTIDKKKNQVNHWDSNGMANLKMYYNDLEKSEIESLNFYISDNGLIKYLIDFLP